jgi:hypothetical protein
MPIPERDALDLIGDPAPGLVKVLVGPCSAMLFKGKKIPLDGRKYVCDGRIFFRNGTDARAKFRVDTTGFDLLELESLLIFHDGLWYHWYEEELLQALQMSKDEAIPFTWLPDRPLDYSKQGPYPMRFRGGA